MLDIINNKMNKLTNFNIILNKYLSNVLLISKHL